MTKRVGLAVMRLQPLHFGHTKIINHMIQGCETAIVCIGSAQESKTNRNPWTVEQRIQMLRNVYADRIKVVPLNDLGAAGPDQWVNYIFEKISKLGMQEPTDYFTGSEADAQWYKEHFWTELFAEFGGSSKSNRRLKYTSSNSLVHTDEKHPVIIRKLHIVERNHNPVPAATEIRTWLETRSEGWKNWVPAVNHTLVTTTYPEELKIPVS